MNEVLVTRGLTKRFPGVIALDNVDFCARAGEVHALMGENGAGKSTLIKAMTGVYPRDGGELLLDGQSVNPASPLAAQQLGIATVYQEVNLIPALSVAENIFLGRLPKFLGIKIDRRKMKRDAEAALARLNVHIDVRKPLQSYSIALQQMVAIARSLSMSAKVLILDEPTSSLDRAEVAQLFDAMRLLKSQGLAIVFVTHFMDQVYAVSDRITVLRNGKLVGEALAADLPRPQLVGMMVGKDPSELQHHAPAESEVARRQEPLVVAKQMGRKHAIEPMDLTINKGEVVGLAGLLGSGRTETAECLFGVHRHDTGEVLVDNQPTKLASPRQAIAHGFGFCPEDRKLAGILPDLSVRENIAIALQAQRGWWRPISSKKQYEMAEKYIKALAIKTSDADKPIRLLSGGNQQKCILARWLASQPRLLILDEPTRGIDIGAKAEIAALVDELSDGGMSVLVISSEVEELVRLCHRVAVLRDRNKIGEVEGNDVSEKGILQRIAG